MLLYKRHEDGDLEEYDHRANNTGHVYVLSNPPKLTVCNCCKDFHVRYNLLDGERVVRDLLAWRSLWYSVLPTRFPLHIPRPGDMEYRPYTELSMLRHARWDSWPADTLYIWTNDEALPQLRQRIEESWETSEVVVISPETDEEMHLAHLDGEHDRVLFVWWD